MRSYLTKRTQKVFYSGCFSDVTGFSCGVRAQGSCLGPLLFTIFPNYPLLFKNKHLRQDTWTKHIDKMVAEKGMGCQ